MTDVFKNRNLWLLISLLALFWAVAAVFPFFVVYEILSGLGIGISIAVIILYLPVALEVFRTKRMTAGQQLAAGICITWFGTALNRGYNLAWRVRYPDQEMFLLTSDFVNFTIWLILIGGILHTTVPDLHTGEIRRRSWLFLVAAIGLGAVVAGFIIGYELREIAADP